MEREENDRPLSVLHETEGELDDERRIDDLLGPPEIDYWLVAILVVAMVLIFGLAFAYLLGWF